LDGTSEGEQTIEELLDLLIAKGVVALNIVPDRNWNVADPHTRRLKVHNLYHVVQLAQELALPLNVGTEMNSFGQKLVDDFDAPELAPVRKPFMDGAYFIYGHTILQRALGLGYQSGWAHAHLPSRRERNRFYTRVGRLVPPGQAAIARLKQLDPTMSPPAILSRLSDHPTTDHPTKDLVTKDHPTKDHPTNDHPTNDHPTKDHVTKDHVTKDHLTKDHPTKDHPTKDHVTKDHVTKDHPTKDHVTKDHVTKDHPTKDHSTKDHPTKDHPTKDHVTN
jgi:hypothetical protein